VLRRDAQVVSGQSECACGNCEISLISMLLEGSLTLCYKIFSIKKGLYKELTGNSCFGFRYVCKNVTFGGGRGLNALAHAEAQLSVTNTLLSDSAGFQHQCVWPSRSC
jgi:hypothetical protein